MFGAGSVVNTIRVIFYNVHMGHDEGYTLQPGDCQSRRVIEESGRSGRTGPQMPNIKQTPGLQLPQGVKPVLIDMPLAVFWFEYQAKGRVVETTVGFPDCDGRRATNLSIC
jgi:hypothetical protein